MRRGSARNKWWRGGGRWRCVDVGRGGAVGGAGARRGSAGCHVRWRHVWGGGRGAVRGGRAGRADAGVKSGRYRCTSVENRDDGDVRWMIFRHWSGRHAERRAAARQARYARTDLGHA
ncbi:hypothetical protein AMAG_08407 [Allomyces macrogynus ATCC 38327]|uniref:Uncharacterized protein n=1 Tax=Allomyces macrogynus (strain ATCC 38327) TaxID=578462 RepID=A0A0L0SL69_ALLM3|nr:hypothetical protein AMAG_08407 [Allomyces macrogynus ATCC 38327]|eukprot:KNE63262.1 hypothetical protein AMAG_08407 [Allomyces macrogynus ATCC 38327]